MGFWQKLSGTDEWNEIKNLEIYIDICGIDSQKNPTSIIEWWEDSLQWNGSTTTGDPCEKNESQPCFTPCVMVIHNATSKAMWKVHLSNS